MPLLELVSNTSHMHRGDVSNSLIAGITTGCDGNRFDRKANLRGGAIRRRRDGRGDGRQPITTSYAAVGVGYAMTSKKPA